MKRSNLESPEYSLVVPGSTLFSPSRQLDIDRETSGIKEIDKNEKNTGSDRLCNAFLKLADALPAFEGEDLFNVHVPEKQLLKKFFTW